MSLKQARDGLKAWTGLLWTTIRFSFTAGRSQEIGGQHRNSKRWIEQHRQAYRVQSLEDGVVMLQKEGPIHAPLELALDRTLQQSLPANPCWRRRCFQPIPVGSTGAGCMA